MEKIISIGVYNLTASRVEGVKLYAPINFWDFKIKELKERGYGCGPGGLGNKIIPDSMYLLCVWWPCAIHDHMYRDEKARTLFDKWAADVVLLTNLNDWIEAKTKYQPMKALRRHRAITYFTAVRDTGEKSFFKGKETKLCRNSE